MKNGNFKSFKKFESWLASADESVPASIRPPEAWVIVNFALRGSLLFHVNMISLQLLRDLI
jgi:hypothetical protein